MTLDVTRPHTSNDVIKTTASAAERDSIGPYQRDIMSPTKLRR